MHRSAKKPAAERIGQFLLFLPPAGAGVLVLLLAFQAWYADRSHRQTTHSVLSDYVALAANEYVRRTTQQLGYYNFYPAMRELSEAEWPQTPQPVPIKKDVAPDYRLVKTYFRYQAASTPDGEPLWWVAGDHHTAFFKTHYQAGLEQRPFKEGEWPWSVWMPADLPIMVFRRETTPAGAVRIEGYLTQPAALQRIFNRSLEFGPLMPRSLGSGDLDNRFLSIRVLDPARRLWFQAGPAEGDIWVTAPYDGAFTGVSVEMAIPLHVASKLIIGGLPKSRLPILLGLLLVTGVLLMTGLILIRRERELSMRQADSIAAISHELRTPLAQIRMFTETLLLERVRSKDEARRSLEIVHQETIRLGDLVENVILFSSSLHGTRPPQPEFFDPVPLMHELVERFTPMARGVKFRVDGVESVQLWADPRLVRRILMNLIDNALKYAAAGGLIFLGVDAAGHKTRLWVEDRGPGVPIAEQRRIWKQFERLPVHRNSAVAGTGIGLWLVQELMRAHGGVAVVEAGNPDGARFVLEFPMAKSQAEAAHE